MMYAVVIFKVDNSVAVVPVSWITNGKYVKWPTCSDNKRQGLCRACEPYEGPGDKLKIQIYAFAETLKEAALLEKKSLNNSHLTSRDETVAMYRRPKRQIHKRKRIVESSSSSSTSSDSMTTESSNKNIFEESETSDEPMMVMAPHPSVANCSLNRAPNEPLLQSTMVRNSSVADILPTSTAFTGGLLSPVNQMQAAPPSAHTSTLCNMLLEMSTNFRDDMRRLIELQQQTQQRLTILDAKVDRLMAQSSCRLAAEAVQLPMLSKSITDFKNLETKLNDKKAAEDFLRSLRQVPGASLGQFLRNALGRLVTNDCAKLMNVSGQNGKCGWKGTNILRLLLDFLNSEPRFIGFETKEVHHIIREWLHNSRKRTSMEVRRSEPKSGHKDANVTM